MPRPIPVHDRWGQHVAWVKRNFVHDLHGKAVLALVREGKVAALTGRIVGSFDRGYFWDLQGHAVAFTAGATSGPLLPVPCVPSNPPSFEVLSQMVGPPGSSLIMSIKGAWSPETWASFVGGGGDPPRAPRVP